MWIISEIERLLSPFSDSVFTVMVAVCLLFALWLFHLLERR